MNYYEVACMIIGNLFFLACGAFVGFFAIYGTYKALSKIPLWEDIRNKFAPKEKSCICEYGNINTRLTIGKLTHSESNIWLL